MKPYDSSVGAEFDIAALRALEKAATPGPWLIESDGIVTSAALPPPEHWPGEHSEIIGSTDVRRIVQTDSGYYPPREADAALIVAMRNALPALLDALDEATKPAGDVVELADFLRSLESSPLFAKAGDLLVRLARERDAANARADKAEAQRTAALAEKGPP